MTTYNQNIPGPTDFPSTSQTQIKDNFNYLCPSTLSTTGLTRDHNMSLNSLNAGDGVHRQVTMSANITSPLFNGGVSVLYPNTANGGSQLFFDNGLGDVQLTTVKASVPTATTSGCSFLPGGLLIQWGQNAGTWAGATTITFPVAFGATPFSITANVVFINNSIREFVQIDTGGTNATQWRPFLVSDGGGSVGSSRTLWWIAIGPA